MPIRVTWDEWNNAISQNQKVSGEIVGAVKVIGADAVYLLVTDEKGYLRLCSERSTVSVQS